MCVCVRAFAAGETHALTVARFLFPPWGSGRGHLVWKQGCGGAAWALIRLQAGVVLDAEDTECPGILCGMCEREREVQDAAGFCPVCALRCRSVCVGMLTLWGMMDVS